MRVLSYYGEVTQDTTFTSSSLCFSVGESRIVLRRGHIGHNFYFVYSGSVFVNVQDTDSDGVQFIKTEAILGRGDSFGVSAASFFYTASPRAHLHLVGMWWFMPLTQIN